MLKFAGAVAFAGALPLLALPGQEAPPPLSPSAPEPAAAEVRAVRERIYRVTEKQARYLLGRVRPWAEDPALKLLTESRSDEHHVRPNAGAVEGLCFLRRYGPCDPAAVGVPRDALLAGTILPMMRYLVATHATGPRATGYRKKWGNQWQSAHWTQMLGRGAWWIWGDLPEDVREGVRRVVAHEADRIAKSNPPHQIRADTKAEENAWNSQVLSVAVLLLPGDPRRPEWERQFQRWAMSSFLRPADGKNDARVDGRPVREQFLGANIFDDFTLENHGFVHPDYMTTFSLSLGCAADFLMTDRKPPEALLHNVPGIYENVKWMLIEDGNFVYPNGQDWEVFRCPAWLAKHVQMSVFGRDPEAWPWLIRTLEVVEKMQARSPSGAIYHEGEYFFPSTQTDILSALARSWLNLGLADPARGEIKPRLGVLRLDGAMVVLRRTPKAVHTFSWGSRAMAQCVPLRMDRVVSPDGRSGVGQVVLAGQKKPLPVKVREVKVESGEDRFRAELVLDHGAGQLEARLSFESRPDGRWIVRERLAALSDVQTDDIATGLIGILNDPHWVYERGRREIVLGGETIEVPAHSGKKIERDGVPDLVIDGALAVRGRGPLRIRYEGARSPERGRATDRLYLNSLPGPRSWKAGEEISGYEVEIEAR